MKKTKRKKNIKIVTGICFVLIISIALLNTHFSGKNRRDRENSSVLDKDTIYNFKCYDSGKTKSVWMTTPNGTYALNAQAISLVENGRINGYPILDEDRNPMMLAKDHFPPEKIPEWILKGLVECR